MFGVLLLLVFAAVSVVVLWPSSSDAGRAVLLGMFALTVSAMFVDEPLLTVPVVVGAAVYNLAGRRRHVGTQVPVLTEP